MKIKDKLNTDAKKIEPLYFAEINEGSTIAYLTKTKSGAWDFTSEHKEAWLFGNPKLIEDVNLLNTLYYNIISFNDLFTPRYNVWISNPDREIYTTVTWSTVGSNDVENPSYLSTIDPIRAQQKLDDLIYTKVHELQNKICATYKIKICVPEVVR